MSKVSVSAGSVPSEALREDLLWASLPVLVLCWQSLMRLGPDLCLYLHTVFFLATSGLRGQLSANKNPQYGVPWKRKLYSVPNSSLMIQHGREAPWGLAALGPSFSSASSSALLCSVPAIASTGETQSSVCSGGGKWAPGARGGAGL